MPAPPLDAPWDAIQAHAIIHGPRDAARSFGLSEGTVMARCAREGWLKHAGTVQVVQPLPRSMQAKASNACDAPTAARNSEAYRSAKGKLYGQRYVVQNLRYAAKLKGDHGLAVADKVKALAGAGQTFFPDWKADAQVGPSISFVLHAGAGPAPEAPAIDV